MNIDKVVELIEKLIEYKVLDQLQGPDLDVGYFFEIKEIREELIKEFRLIEDRLSILEDFRYSVLSDKHDGLN